MSENIVIKGAKEHNLKNIDLSIPKNKLIVFTGVSGSGKSSLAFDTIYAEGQRRYVESLSSYARQFLGKLEKPVVDSIEGLSPAISIEQKKSSNNPRSTVGTVTEIYDYMRVLFARTGELFCPDCNIPVKGYTLDEIVSDIIKYEGEKAVFLAPVVKLRKGEYHKLFESIRNDGFIRARVDGKMINLEDGIPELEKNKKHTIEIVIDRTRIKSHDRARISEASELALKKGKGIFSLWLIDKNEELLFSELNSCSKCGFSFPEISPRLFSFNSPSGMCEACHGLGIKSVFSEEKALNDSNISLNKGALRYFGKLKDKKDTWYYKLLKALSKKYNFSFDTPYCKLPEKVRKVILYGDDKVEINWEKGGKSSILKYEGIGNSIFRLFYETSSEGSREFYRSFLEEKTCLDCNGARLNKMALSVRIGGKNIFDITEMSLEKALIFFENLEFDKQKKEISKILLSEIINRLKFLNRVGLGYISMSRNTSTLSGGEAQRIRLASQLGSRLTGVIYVLDEPSIGLHQRDNDKLITTLKELKDLGNTVIVVEHDEDTMRTADFIVDFGPRAGNYGGEIVFSGSPARLIKNKKSLTAKYLRNEISNDFGPKWKESKRQKWLELNGVRKNNLKNVDVRFPVSAMSVVTGVSGSGKSSLIYDVLYEAVRKKMLGRQLNFDSFDTIKGVKNFKKVLCIDQEPIGRTPRSNPIIYVGGFTPIREIFADIPESRIRGYKSGRFSFNVKGGRCEACQGGGRKRIEMLFLPDVFVECDICNGKRFNKETLSIKFKGLNINDILELSVDEGYELFESYPKVKRYFQTLKDVGLGYIKLGQPATTLSGGEAQRVKLARELTKVSSGDTLYLLDEPTTGLHFDDVSKLIKVLKRLVEKGNTIIMIEHNLDIISASDYIVDLGPEGGEQGGNIIYSGASRGILECHRSFTGKYLKEYLRRKNE